MWSNDEGNEKCNFFICTTNDLKSAAIANFDYEYSVAVRYGIAQN
jgi:hypothetical protein